MKITAVVVTFNRKELLAKCLDSLLTQTIKLDHIIVIDNASTDGTSELIRNKYLSDNSTIIYKSLPVNNGGSAGFHEGIKEAMEIGSEWIWLMDDDVYAIEKGLFTILNNKNNSLCLQVGREYIDGEKESWGGLFDSNTLTVKNSNTLTTVTVGCFEGMFIHRSIIHKVGLPDKRFFLLGDDTIYGYIVSNYEDIILLKETILIKQIKREKKFIFGRNLVHDTPIYAYLYSRNQFLIRENLGKLKKKNITNYYFALLNSLKAIIVYFLYYRSLKLTKCSIIGAYHGITHKFDNHRDYL